jgi:hypothetical protein
MHQGNSDQDIIPAKAGIQFFELTGFPLRGNDKTKLVQRILREIYFNIKEREANAILDTKFF